MAAYHVSMLRILLIHSCAGERQQLASILVAEGFEVITASDSASGLRKLHEALPWLVIMDEELTPLNNQELCSRIREVTEAPIIVLGKEEERARMLALGADAYLVTPVCAGVLIARVHSLLRCYKGLMFWNDESFPVWLFDSLTSTESRVLSCLVLNKGRVVSYPQLVTEVWGGQAVSLDNLHFYVRRLQQKIANGAISQLRGVGYRLSLNGTVAGTTL